MYRGGVWWVMTQRRSPEPSNLSDAQVPGGEDEGFKAYPGATAPSYLNEIYHVDYRPFGGSFYGSFFTSAGIFNLDGSYTLNTTKEMVSSWGEFSTTYPSTRTSPIDTQFPTDTSWTGMIGGDFSGIGMDFSFNGRVDNASEIYVGVTADANRDPEMYPLKGRFEFDGPTDTLEYVRVVTSFPVRAGTTVNAPATDFDTASARCNFAGVALTGTGSLEISPWYATQFMATGIIQTPDGDGVVPGAGDEFNVSSGFPSFLYNQLYTEKSSRVARNATPIREAGTLTLRE
jgi:hypothetical protein